MTALRLDQIEVDPTIQIRQKLDESAIERYSDAFDELPPPVVYEIDGSGSIWIEPSGDAR